MNCLIQGADDEYINFKEKDSIKNKIQKELCIDDNQFIVCTGGKLDKNKGTLELMEACAELTNVTLVLFGSVVDEIKKQFNQILQEKDNIKYVGWIDSIKVYDYFLASDLVVFPGQHSVLWEQACACKVPCAFKKYPQLAYCNAGGNATFFENCTAGGIQKKIIELIFTEKYVEMKQEAESNITDCFLYSNIAENSIKI